MPPGNSNTQVKQIIVRATGEGAKEMNALAKQMAVLNKNTAATSKTLKNFGNVFQTIFAASFLGVGITEITNMIDSMQQLRDRLSLVTKEGDTIEGTFQDIVQAANRSRVSVDDFAASFTRMAMATQQTGLSTQSLLMVTEALQKTFLISGSTAKEAAAASIQLSQGLASGVLRGEEFNSVLEQNLFLGQALAKHITGGDGTVGALRALAKQGKLTNDQVLRALAKSMVDIEAKAGKMRLTIGQSLTIAFNGLLVVVDKLNEKFGLGTGIAKGIFVLVDSLKYLGVILGILAVSKMPALIDSVIKLGTVIMKFAKANPMFLALTALGLVALYVYDNFDMLKGEVLALGANFSSLGDSITESTNKFRLWLVDITGGDVEKVKKNLDALAADARKSTDEMNKRAAEALKKGEKNTKSFADRFADLMKDIFNMNGKSMAGEQKSKEMLADLNREYLALKIGAAEYYEQLDKVGRRMAEKDFKDGKKSLYDLNEEFRQLSTSNLNREFAQGRASLEGYNMALDSIAANAAWDKMQAGKTTAREYNEELAKIPGQLSTFQSMTLGVQRYYDSIGTYANGIAKVSETVLNSVEDEVVGWLVTGEATWEDFGKTVVTQIAKIAYQMMIAKPIIESVMNMLNPGASNIETSGNSVGGGSYMMNAKGNAFGSSGVIPFATGGVVNSPTMFGFGGGKAGLMGEAGPEAIMPLKRGSNGDLGVQATTAPVYVVVNNNAGGTEASQRETTGPNGEKQIEITINSIVAKGLSNGTFDKPMGTNYGLRRKGIA